MFGLLEISHYFYRDYSTTDVFFQKSRISLLYNDYTSYSILKRTRNLNLRYTLGPVSITSDNVISSSSSENSIGFSGSKGFLSFGGDIRFLRTDNLTNNSGAFIRVSYGGFNVYAEYRPLLKTLKASPNLSHNLKITTFNLSGNFTYFKYSLPYFSEEKYEYDIIPSLQHGNSLGYKLQLWFSSSKSIASPSKDRENLLGNFEVFLKDTFTISYQYVGFFRTLGKYAYPGMESEKWEDMTGFDYTPSFYGFITFKFSLRRYLNVYFGQLSRQSYGIREMLSEGKINLKNFEIYLRRKREDYVYLNPSTSGESKVLIRYSMGFSSSFPSFRINSSIFAVYTYYTFKPADNNLNRYLETEGEYKGGVELSFKVRFSDMGWLMNGVYYRSQRYVDAYSSGWIPVVALRKATLGAKYDLRPDGSGVGLGTRFPGGDMYVLRRVEERLRFWEFSLRFSSGI